MDRVDFVRLPPGVAASPYRVHRLTREACLTHSDGEKCGQRVKNAGIAPEGLPQACHRSVLACKYTSRRQKTPLRGKYATCFLVKIDKKGLKRHFFVIWPYLSLFPFISGYFRGRFS
jgi:hypothetical protein